MSLGDKIDDIVDGIVDAIETAITKMLAGGASSMIQESLNLFKAGMKVDDGSTIGGNLTTMPNDYNSSIWNIVYIYRQYAVGSVPNYWFKEDVMDEWNAIICKFCNELPEEAKQLSKWQKTKLRWHYRRLIIKDSLPD